MDQELARGLKILEAYDPGLGERIARALSAVKQSGPRVARAVVRAATWQVCQVALKEGMHPVDLCLIATTILEEANEATNRLQQELDKSSRKDETARAEAELTEEGMS